MRYYFDKLFCVMAILFISVFMISAPVFAEDEGTVENVDTMSSYEQTADVPVEYKSYGYYTVTLPTKFDNSNQFKNNIKVKMDYACAITFFN